MVGNTKAKVYFDGLCPLCSKEIDHYKKLRGSENLTYIDIHSSDFSPQYEGVDPVAVHKIFHVRDERGQLHKGVDGFRVIWKTIPRYQWLARFSILPVINSCFLFAYWAFARIRPFLPRKKSTCSDSKYCDQKIL